MARRLREILEILTAAVTEGAVEVLTTRRDGHVVADYKDARELVTTADKRSDSAILAIFHERFPGLDSEVVFQLEESGFSGEPGQKIAGADPLDGTNHFAAGGNLYSIQAHYVEDGIPQAGVVFQPEIYFPLSETENPSGRLAWAIRGEGAFLRGSTFRGRDFAFSDARPLVRRIPPPARSYVACVPISTKMSTEERERASRVHQSGLIAASTGTGGAGGNVMMAILGGQHVYANFGAGDDLDLIPPQVIAIESGLTVWGMDRRQPVWKTRKQPFVAAPSPEIAEAFLQAAGV
ncbi:MAG TPA: inositol monophosphatase family protein [Bryobacteraceae bacterium]|jgi:3'-phosphoadenosine 5'-phosphosulfate (PAPS) 3'-phosphatase